MQITLQCLRHKIPISYFKLTKYSKISRFDVGLNHNIILQEEYFYQKTLIVFSFPDNILFL